MSVPGNTKRKERKNKVSRGVYVSGDELTAGTDTITNANHGDFSAEGLGQCSAWSEAEAHASLGLCS